MKKANVICKVTKSYQSPTTPVVHLSYMVDIVSIQYGINGIYATLGEDGVFDTDDEDVKKIIELLEKLHFKQLYPNGIK